MSVRVGSMGETHTCVNPEASCVPVRSCRGGPRSWKNTAGGGRTHGKQTGSPELPRIATPDQPVHLGMESPFSGERKLS